MPTKSERVRLGTRGSALALAQSQWVSRQILRMNPSIQVEIAIIRTAPDRAPNLPLSAIGDKALWVADLETQLINGDIDLAVHSMKDLPAELPPELCIVPSPRRECALDALVLPAGHARDSSLADPEFAEIPAHAAAIQDALHHLLPQGARIGTSSARRASQLLHWRPDLLISSMRGNVDSRLRKLDGGGWDALVLAAAGLRRLDRSDRISALFPPSLMLPAAGQGTLAIEVRRNNVPIQALLQELGHGDTAAAVEAERAFVRAIEGGCSIPLGAYARCLSDSLELSVRAIHPGGKGQSGTVLEIVRSTEAPPVMNPLADVAWAAELGRATADEFLASGGAAFIAQLKAQEQAVS